jgi:hypothetical protein
MVLAYWGAGNNRCDTLVSSTIAGVIDETLVLDGDVEDTGNWPFNTAYAAASGEREAYVLHFDGLAEAERWIAADIPLVLSYDSQLIVLVGFSERGDPIINDPSLLVSQEVQFSYPRPEFEATWLATSLGTAYVIYPVGAKVP